MYFEFHIEPASFRLYLVNEMVQASNIVGPIAVYTEHDLDLYKGEQHYIKKAKSCLLWISIRRFSKSGRASLPYERSAKEQFLLSGVFALICCNLQRNTVKVKMLGRRRRLSHLEREEKRRM